MDGPVNARVYVYGERPGQTEQREIQRALDEGDYSSAPDQHYCFVGDAGKEFNQTYLPLSGLNRHRVRVGNAAMCGASQNKKPSREETLACALSHVPAELAAGKPEVVILMGATACTLMNDGKGVDLESEHGIPRLGRLYQWTGWIVPMYHPAAGMYDSAMMIPMLEDWEKLEQWLEYGTWMWAEDDGIARDYALIETKQELDEYLHLCEWGCDWIAEPLIGADTESHDGEPYSWQVSMHHRIARMVMLKNRDVGKRLAKWLVNRIKFPAKFVFHYAPADLPIFEQQLETVLDSGFTDTMIEGYGFSRYGRLGLKPLSRRILGRQRLSWEETVTPYSKEKLDAWMCNGYAHAVNNWTQIEQTYHKKTGKPNKTRYVRSEEEKLLLELRGYMWSNPDYEIWKKLVERMPKENLTRLLDVSGFMPMKGIAHCPLDVQIEYACSDPDDTRQLAVLFKEMRQELVKELNVQLEDVDA